MSKTTESTTKVLEAGESHKLQTGTPGVDDFFWTYTEEPHASRRKLIIKAHPEVTKLNGPDPITKYVIFGVVAIQFWFAYYLRNTSLKSPIFWIIVYFVGAVCQSNLFLAIHEMCHNLCFKKPLYNKLYSMFANLPIGIPYSAGFGYFHLLHHKFQGDTIWDADLPSKLEAQLFSSVAGKAFFATFQLLFYAIRPPLVIKMELSKMHYANIAVQVVADYILVHFWGWNALAYFVASSFVAGSLHPIAAHFIAEHYLLEPPRTFKCQDEIVETYSYYGPLNFLVYNAGYHTEHHDFPYIPWTRLPKLRQIAKEFYDPLPYHTSWSKALVDFVVNPKVTLWCRVEREPVRRDAAK